MHFSRVTVAMTGAEAVNGPHNQAARGLQSIALLPAYMCIRLDALLEITFK